MIRLLLTRAALAILFMWIASSAMLGLVWLSPGDATSDMMGSVSERARMAERTRLGLDRPFSQQYAGWLTHAVRLDLGSSLRYHRPVLSLVAERAANTALLAVAAFVLAVAIGLPLGVLTGSERYPLAGALVRSSSLLMLSVPPLLLSLLLLWVAARTGWLPTGGMTTASSDEWSWWTRAGDLVAHLTLPVMALAVPLAAALERLQSAAVMTQKSAPFVMLALARGASADRVLWRDVWRAALTPVLGVLGLAAGRLLSGSLAVELVTAWPGLGRLMFDALGWRDAPLAAGCGAAAALALVTWSTVAEIVARRVDPRMHDSTQGGGA